MKEPSAPIFHDLQTAYAGILSPAAVKAANDHIGRAAVGTGPYKLTEFQTGQQITLERNADYKWPPALFANRGAPYIQELRYRVIPEPATQLAALDAGEVDVLGLAAKDLARYSADGRFKIYDSFTYGLTYLGFDAKRPPFDNAKLRQAPGERTARVTRRPPASRSTTAPRTPPPPSASTRSARRSTTRSSARRSRAP